MLRLSKGFILLCSAMLMGVLAACGAAPVPTLTPAPSNADEEIWIGLIVGAAGINDGGFNELAFGGVSGASRRLGASQETISLEGVVEADYLATMDSFIQGNPYDVIVTVGFDLTEETLTLAAQYPQIHFVGIDQFQTESVPNVAGVVFREDHAGYLAGVVAASLSSTDIVGGVYGAMIPPVQAFASGFESGARATNPEIEVLTVFHPQGPDVAFGDIEWGTETAQTLLESGADVIFSAAGDTGRGALVAVANRASRIVPNESPLYCIGVDTDQWLTVPQAQPCLVTSAVKDIPRAVDSVIVQIADGNAPSGNYYGPVGLASFHDFEGALPSALKTELERIEAGLLSGEIVITNN